MQNPCRWSVTEGKSVCTWRENVHQVPLKALEEVLDNRAIPLPSYWNKWMGSFPSFSPEILEIITKAWLLHSLCLKAPVFFFVWKERWMHHICRWTNAFASSLKCQHNCFSRVNKGGGNLNSLIFVLSVHPQKEMCFLLIIVYVTENTKYMQLFPFTCQNG